MKQFFALVFAFICTITCLSAQIFKPVHWKFDTKKINDTEFDLIATAKLDKGWYTYSQFIKGDGPLPTTFTFKPSVQYQLVGKNEEASEHTKSGFDKIFDMNITKFSDEVRFTQHVKLKTPTADISGNVTFQSCDDEKCLPPNDEDFNYKLIGNSSVPIQTTSPAKSTINTAPAVTPTNLPEIKPDKNTPPVKNGTAQQATLIAPAFVPPVKSGGIDKPAHWTFLSNKMAEPDKDGNVLYNIVAKATIDKTWHIYSQFLKGDEGPLPTTLKFDKSNLITLIEKATEQSPKRREHKEPAFNNMTVTDFEDSVTITQRIKIKQSDVNLPVKGSIEFMVCNNEKCLPPDEIPFAINLLTGKGDIVSANFSITNQPTNPPINQLITNPSLLTLDKSMAQSNCDGTETKNLNSSNWWVIFVLGFGGGLVALLTPCVFPMIPLTVSFFTKRSKDRKTGIRNALVYAASIIIIYVGMGFIVTQLFGAGALNNLATNPWMNILFGILFLIFAFSFFGFYEITLPSKWSNAIDAQSYKREGLGGIFFMAFTLALVSFSCTGPIIGSLLVESVSGNGFSFGPLIGMFGFALALALPFGLFAFFPAMLNALPKAGSWMDDVKVTLGFLEIALAFKFLSNADLINGWKLLPYEGVLAIWILCALGLALYHGGILRFGHDPIKKFTPLRISLIVASVGALFYLGSGYRFNPTANTFDTPGITSGILPPAGYSYIYPQRCPLNLPCFHDLNEGLAFAKKVNKPILLDFTGWNCANCRKMEENVWNKPGITELIRDKYVLISLYTDDKSALKSPYTEYTSSLENKTVNTEGKLWTDFEATHFNRNAQPFYVLMSPDLKVLNAPVAYTPNVAEYKTFLACGLERFAR